MSVPVADEFSAIAARMREIRAEADAAKPLCEHCEGVGWVYAAENRVTALVVCPHCNNALERPQPCS